MKKIFLIILLSIVSFSVFSQKKKNNEKSNLESLSISGLKWRSVGPALTSGRISDIAVNPNKPFEYYVAVVKPGRILFEISGVPEDVAREAMRKAGHKLPMKTKFVMRDNVWVLMI